MKIKCPACQAVLNIPETAAGKVVKCPCGKQLRAPNPTGSPNAKGSANVAPTRPGATTAQANATRPASQASPTSGQGGFDPDLLDELTDQDLQPVASQSVAGVQPTMTAGGKTGNGSTQIASVMSRFIGALVDFFIQAGGAMIGVGCYLGARAAMGDGTASIIIGAILITLFSLAPVIINIVLIVKSGQTLGKKAAGTRIVIADTYQLPGFVQGWFLRSFVFGLLASIPGVALVDVCFVFSENARTLHDRLAGTIVVVA